MFTFSEIISLQILTESEIDYYEEFTFFKDEIIPLYPNFLGNLF